MLPVTRHIVPAVKALERDVSASKPQAGRDILSDTAMQVAGARLAWFFDGLESAYGQLDSVGFGLGTMRDASRQARDAAARAGTTPQPPHMPKPVDLRYRDAQITLYVFVDEAALNNQQVRVLDLLAVDPKAWTARALLPEGPGIATAKWMGLTIIEPESNEPTPTDLH